MTETPYFFESGGRALFGVYHAPTAATVRAGFVFCHPFGEEKLWAHRVFVSFARRLAAAGHPVLRFDFMGSGDSDGDLSEASLDAALTDVRAAVAELQARTGSTSISLLGLRLGATIASVAAEAMENLRHLVLWSPVVHGGRYMQELLRVNLTTQVATSGSVTQDRDAMVAAMQQGTTVNVDGYEMPWPFFSQISAVDLGGAPHAYVGPCLVVHIDRQTARPSSDIQRLMAVYPSATLATVQEEPFWKEIARFYEEAPSLFQVTEDWLRMHP